MGLLPPTLDDRALWDIVLQGIKIARTHARIHVTLTHLAAIHTKAGKRITGTALRAHGQRRVRHIRRGLVARRSRCPC